MLYRERNSRPVFRVRKKEDGKGEFKSDNMLNALFKLSIIFFLVLSGCSSKDSGSGTPDSGDQQDTVERVCELGVWNGESCVNSKVCTRNTECLQGMTCEAGKCMEAGKTGKSCKGDSECGNGRYCGNGKCQALRRCQTRGECEREEYCLYGVCMTEDRICKDLRCGVAPHTGVCAPESGSCVNATSCLTNGVPDDSKCVSTYFCNESGVCTFDLCGGNSLFSCNDNRGVCDKATGSCVSRKICKQDEDCLKGLFCVRADANSAGVCKKEEDRCKLLDPNGCPGRKECVVDSDLVVSCHEPRECVSTSDCDKGKVCHSEHEYGFGACVEASKLSAIEEDSFDSNENANDSKDAPTVCTSETKTEVLCKEVEGKELTVKGDNEDWYKFSANADGTLTVTLTVNGRDVGNAEVQVELYDATQAAPLRTATTAEHQASQQGQSQEKVRYKDRAEVKMLITQAKRGEYYAKVSILGSELRGVHYSLDINLVGSQEYDDCSNTSLLRKIDFAGKDTVTIKSDMMSDRTTSLLSPSCAEDLEGKNTDVVYELDVDNESLIEVKLQNDGDEEPKNIPALSIRRVCQSAKSEMGCSLGSSTSQESGVTLAKTLKVGRYYLILTSSDVAESNLPFFNKYRLTVTKTATICSERDNVCKSTDNNILIKCNDTKTEMVEVTCPKGCDKNKNECTLTEGDTCVNAIEMTGTHFDKTYQVKDFEDVYHVYQGSACTKLQGKEYKGKDFVVKTAVVPAGQILRGSVDARVTVAVYVTEECTDSKVKKCIMGKELSKANSNQSFNIFNNSGEDKVYYIIFDYAKSFIGTTTVTLDIGKPLCHPGEPVCAKSGTESRVCNEQGNGYMEPKKCDCGCDTNTGKCLRPNDTCHTGAPAKCPLKSPSDPDETILFDSQQKVGKVDERVVRTGRIEDASDSIENFACIGNDPKGGRDYVYKIIPPTNKAVTYSFELDSTGTDSFDAIMWYSETCDSSTSGKETLTKCIAGVDEQGSNKPEKLTYYYEAQPNPKPFWLVIEPYGSKTEHGSFILTAKVVESHGKPRTYGKCVGATNNEPAYLPYYDQFGNMKKELCDAKGCSADLSNCANPSGRTCQQAKKLYPTTDQNGHLVGSGSETVQLDLLKCQKDKDPFCSQLYPKPLPLSFKRTVGNCVFTKASLPEKGAVFYSFELNVGETLNIDYNEHEKNNAHAFFMKKCGSVDSCEGGIIPPGSNKLTYTAKKDETIFFVIKLADDNIDSSSKSLDFKWKIENNSTSCQPNTFFCKTEDTVAYCNENGQVVEPGVKCPVYSSSMTTGECKFGSCLVSPPAEEQQVIGDTCDTPINLGEVQNIAFTVERQHFGSNVETSCVYSTGKDAVFKLSVQKDKLLTINISQIDEYMSPKAYLLDANKIIGCNANEKLKCEDFVEIRNSTFYPKKNSITYYVKEKSDFYLVLDDYSSSDSPKMAYLSINVSDGPIECRGEEKRNGLIGCSNDQKGIDLCYKGQKLRFDCTDPCKSDVLPPNCDSSDLKCDTSKGFASCNSLTWGSAAKSGLYCFDAIPFEPKNNSKSQVFHGDGREYKPTPTSPVVVNDLLDGCVFDDSDVNNYGEQYYSVYLKKGEKLSAQLKSDSQYSRLYIMTGCYNKDATCESVRLDNISTSNNELKYVAREDGYVYVIHDVTVAVNPFKYDLTLTKYNATEDFPCVPFDSYCDENGNVVQCTSDGRVVRRPCRYGKNMCKSGSCLGEESERDQCSNIASGEPDIKIPKNLSIDSDRMQIYSSVLKFSQMTNNVDMPNGCKDIDLKNTEGNDAFFKVQVPPGGTIRTYLVAPSLSDAKLLVYYLKDNGCENPQTSCLKIIKKSEHTKKDEYYQTEYKNTTATQQNIIVGVDSYTDSGTPNRHNRSRKIYIEVDVPNCDPNIYGKICSQDHQSLTYCSPKGFIEKTTCLGGCVETSGDDKCAMPSGDVCSNAFHPAFDSNNAYNSSENGTPHSLVDATDAIHLEEGNFCPTSGSITLYHAQTGRDRIYEVELDPNQTLTATVKSLETPTEDLSLYVVDDCEMAKDHCLIGSDSVPEGDNTDIETVSYTNQTTSKKTIFVIVDSWNGVRSNGNPIEGKYLVTMKKEISATP